MVKVGDKFWCNKLLVKDASDTVFTISEIYPSGTTYRKKVRLIWNGGKENADYDLSSVEEYFRNGVWLNIRSVRREKLRRINSL